MTPNEIRNLIETQLLKDFTAKIGNDTIDLIHRNERVLLGGLPPGFGAYVSLIALAGVMNSILCTCVDVGMIKRGGGAKIAEGLYESIREGL